jgi:hypothetical protein
MSLVLWLLFYSAVTGALALLMVPKVRVWTAPLYFVVIFGLTYGLSLIPGMR